MANVTYYVMTGKFKALVACHGNYADASKESGKYKGCREKTKIFKTGIRLIFKFLSCDMVD